MAQQKRLLPKQVGTRTGEAWMAACVVHTSSGRFWGTGCGQKTYETFEKTLEGNYTVKTKWEGTWYIGISLDWVTSGDECICQCQVM